MYDALGTEIPFIAVSVGTHFGKTELNEFAGIVMQASDMKITDHTHDKITVSHRTNRQRLSIEHCSNKLAPKIHQRYLSFPLLHM